LKKRKTISISNK